MVSTSAEAESRPSLMSLAGPSYFPVSALARLPSSMLTIGVLTYVVDVAGVAQAGLIAAIAGIGVALGAPVMGMASDRWGQRHTLLVASVAYAASLGWVLAAGGLSDSIPALAAAALVAGLTVPQAGPMTRVRWIRRLGGRGPGEAAALDSAQSYESTIDEMSFVLGPALVGLLAAATAPAVPLWVALVLALVAVPWFALHPTAGAAAPERGGPRGARSEVPDGAEGSSSSLTVVRARMPYAIITVLLLGMLSIGTIFGSLATASTSFAEEAGRDGTGGLIYATMGITSGIAALSVSKWSPRFTATRRWLTCAAVLMPILASLWLAGEPLTMSLLFLAVGAPIGPVLVTVFAIAGRVTPVRRLGLIMTLLAAGITLGTSIGNWLGGILAQNGGHSATLWVSMSAGVVLFAVGLACTWLLRAGQGESAGATRGPRMGA
jgi:predicted MFS family arabinose efflux permease